MHRRRFLAAAGAAAALPLAGCSLPVGNDADPEPLGPPDETTGYEYNHSYRYRVGTPERVTLDVEFGTERGLLSLRTVLTAHDALRHDRFRLDVETNPSDRREGVGTRVWTTGTIYGESTVEQWPIGGATVVAEFDGLNGAQQLPVRIERENTDDDVRLDVAATFGTGDTLETTYELDHGETYAVPTPATD